MNIKEQFRKILNEFTVDKDGKPVYPSDTPSIGDVAQKHGYTHIRKTDYQTEYEHDNGKTIIHHHDDNMGAHGWSHVDSDDNQPDEDDPEHDEWDSHLGNGDTSKQLDKHLNKHYS